MTLSRTPIASLIQEMPIIEQGLMLRAPITLIVWPRNHKRIAAAQRLKNKGLLTEKPYSCAIEYTLTPRGQSVVKALKRRYGVHPC